jgi:hypothetical protein
MDNLNSNTPSQTGATDMQAQYEALRHLVVSILILVVVISGTLNIYLLRQWRSTSKDLGSIRPQFEMMIAKYNQETRPLMSDFVEKCKVYARSPGHADFALLLARHNIKAAAPASLPPAPSPAALPKK